MIFHYLFNYIFLYFPFGYIFLIGWYLFLKKENPPLQACRPRGGHQ